MIATRKMTFVLITETEEAECFACKILPMTSTYGQGNFSAKRLKAGNEESSKVETSAKTLTLTRCTEWKECYLKVGYADALFNTGGILTHTSNNLVRTQRVPCYQNVVVSSMQLATHTFHFQAFSPMFSINLFYTFISQTIMLGPCRFIGSVKK